MTIHWGIDPGTSNTTICEDRSGSPRIVNLPGLVKLEPLTQTPVVVFRRVPRAPSSRHGACRP